MVTRRKLRSVLSTLGLYIGCAVVIAYFGVNAHTGRYGLRAQQHLDQHYAELTEELARLKQERAAWQHRVNLLKSNSIDPDTLEERSRAMLNYLDPRDVTMMLKKPQG
jgi:cell division protein FtsB